MDDQQLDIFEACYVDIPIRDQRDTMERPFFSLAKSPRNSRSSTTSTAPSLRFPPVDEYGIATIWDADILIWAATQITEVMDRGGTPSRKIQFHPYTLLKGIRRRRGRRPVQEATGGPTTAGIDYIQTSIRTPKGARTETVGFHWIEQWYAMEEERQTHQACRSPSPTGFMTGIVQGGGVLTIHQDYFELKGGIERWLYRVARKACWTARTAAGGLR